ncbi:MAG: ABC transporter ATP-binding protein, partial [Dehalococcoidales bacterium]|nr:ABC transporter ATP-binding protein [Dehalococcoidales bacterium]
MLEVKGLTKDFGGLRAVNNLDLTIKPGELVGLCGPNGAGKTTFFNLITGYIRPSHGQVMFEGKDITGKTPHSIARLGIVRTFQHSSIFSDLTVLENVVMARHLKTGVGFLETVLNTRGNRCKDEVNSKCSQDILRLVGLGDMAQTMAKTLAHGHKRMLGIAIALAAEPRLLFLDEPLSGMNGEEITDAMVLIKKLWEKGITILLIEHNMRAAMGLCQRMVMVSFGKKIAEGPPDEIKRNPDVVKS